MAFRLSRSLIMACVPLLGLSACAYGDGYGYGGMSAGVGYADGYGYGGYGDGFYGPAGGFGGWYNDFYYPGNGYYVFDRGGRRYRWNDRQRTYWEARRQQYRGNDGRGRDGRWNDGRGNDRPGYVRPRDGDRGDRWRGRDRREDGAGRPPRGSTPDGTPGRNWQGRSGDQGRQWRSENRPAPSAGQGFRGGQQARPESARPTPSVRQATPRGAEPRTRTQPE